MNPPDFPDLFAAACPRCPAQPGELCQDRSGKPHSTHAARHRLATTGTPQRNRPPAETPGAKPNPQKNLPMMNRQAFTCPRCGVWSAEFTTKIVKDRNEWVHQRCVIGERDTVLRERYAPTQNIDQCATCGGRLHAGNRTANRHGEIVHAHGCPKRTSRPATTSPP